MGRFVRLVGRIFGWLGNIQAVYAIVPAGALSAVSGVAGYLSDGLGWGLFMASGVFVFVALGITLMRESYRANRLEHKLTVTDVWVQQFANILLFRPKFVIHNSANFELFFEVITVDYVFGKCKGGLDPTVALSGLLSPHESTTILVPSAQGELPFPQGRVLIKIKYGREKDQLVETVSTVLECHPLTTIPQEHEGDMPMSRLVQTLDYTPVKP